MKLIKNLNALLFLVLSAAAFTSCEKSDGNADYGYASIYMPQATVSGGLNALYPVPAGGGGMTYNFRINSDTNVDIILGVLKAGKFSKNDAFSVDVTVNDSLTNANVVGDTLAVAMPASMYVLPAKAVVKKDEISTTFYLTVDANALKLNAYTGKKLVLAVGLSNPSIYSLAAANTNTVVVINVDAIRAHLK